jgi:hypothetical protein
MTDVISDVSVELELLAKQLEVILHPAWHGAIDERTAAAVLQDGPVMAYLLRQGSEGEYHYWLSHKKSDGEIHHRHFAIRRFSDGWCFGNLRAPSREHLDDFVRGALACKE